MEVTITNNEKKMFDFLNRLRDSGKTNMFGAGIYLISSFGVFKKEADNTLSKWMENFNENGYENLTIKN
jgi:hypothetical protein